MTSLLTRLLYSFNVDVFNRILIINQNHISNFADATEKHIPWHTGERNQVVSQTELLSPVNIYQQLTYH